MPKYDKYQPVWVRNYNTDWQLQVYAGTLGTSPNETYVTWVDYKASQIGGRMETWPFCRPWHAAPPPSDKENG